MMKLFYKIFLVAIAFMSIAACASDDEILQENCDSAEEVLTELMSGSVRCLVTYNADNTIFQMTGPSDEEDYTKFTYEFDADGNLLSKFSPQGEGLVGQKYEFEYEQGKRSKGLYYSTVSPGAPLELQQTIYFSWTNDRLTKIEKEQQNNIFEIGTFSYSDDGKVMDFNYQKVDGTDERSGTYYFSDIIDPKVDLYTTFGYPISDFAIDSIYNVQPSQPVEISRFRHETDSNGRIVNTEVKSSNDAAFTALHSFTYDCLQE